MNVENLCKTSNPAASRPSPFTIHHFLAFLTRSLMTKTGESPSACNRLSRKAYHLAVALDKDFPGHMDDLSRRCDLLERGHPLSWYAAQIRVVTKNLRHELTQERLANRFPSPTGPQPVTSIKSILAAEEK